MRYWLLGLVAALALVWVYGCNPRRDFQLGLDGVVYQCEWWDDYTVQCIRTQRPM